MKLKENFDPKKTLELVGYEKNFNFLKNLSLKDKLPKVLLLTGEKGIGKSTFVNHFMHFYFDAGNYDEKNFLINKKNKFYNQFSEYSYPNIIYFDNLKYSDVKIDDIRKLKNELLKTPIINDKRFVILDDVEAFNINCLNALLKIIEEPGENNYFILINNKSQILLNTIKSRSLEFKIIFNNNDKDKIILKLIKNFDQKMVLNKDIIKVSPGNFIRFNNFFQDNNLAIDEDYLVNFNKILNFYKKEKNFFYKDLLIFLTDYYLLISKTKKLIKNGELIDKINFFIKNINYFFLYNLNQNTLLNSIEGKIK